MQNMIDRFAPEGRPSAYMTQHTLICFSHLRWEAVGFVALTWGYVGLQLGELLFRRLSLLKSVMLNVALFGSAATALSRGAVIRSCAAKAIRTHFEAAFFIRPLPRHSSHFGG